MLRQRVEFCVQDNFDEFVVDNAGIIDQVSIAAKTDVDVCLYFEAGMCLLDVYSCFSCRIHWQR